MVEKKSNRKAKIMTAVRVTTQSETRKTFDVRPSQAPVNYDQLIDEAMKRFPKVHAILAQ